MKNAQKKESTTKTTFEREMEDPEFRKLFEKEYEALALSEMLVDLMELEGISVRELAKHARVSATVIQDIRSGKQENPTLSVLSKLIHSMGGEIVIKKGQKTLATV
jgi:predicted transcriptional regulator